MAILIEPPQNELSALQNLSDSAGFLKKTGDGSYSIDTNSYLPLAGGTVTGVTNFSLGLSAANLHVSGGASLGTIQLGDTATTGYYSRIFQNGNNLDIIANGDQAYRVSVGTNNGSGLLRFFTANLANGNTERMRITAWGNIGIGTTAPTTKLDVVGTVTASSFSVGSNKVISDRRTGWTAPTGTPTRTTFATSTVTLVQLAERVKGLIDDLIAHGLIGA